MGEIIVMELHSINADDRAFKLARDTLRLAVEQYGWSRLARGYYDTQTGAPVVTSRRYRAPPGKFQGEHWSIVYYYDAVMNGFGGESFGTEDRTECDVLDVTDVERDAFKLKAGTAHVAVLYSELGFVSMRELTDAEYAELAESYESEEEPS